MSMLLPSRRGVACTYFGSFKDNETSHLSLRRQDGRRTRSSGFGPLLSFFTCFHFGLHLAHHLYPSLPWFRLPLAAQAAEEEEEEEGADRGSCGEPAGGRQPALARG